MAGVRVGLTGISGALKPARRAIVQAVIEQITGLTGGGGAEGFGVSGLELLPCRFKPDLEGIDSMPSVHGNAGLHFAVPVYRAAGVRADTGVHRGFLRRCRGGGHFEIRQFLFQRFGVFQRQRYLLRRMTGDARPLGRGKTAGQRIGEGRVLLMAGDVGDQRVGEAKLHTQAPYLGVIQHVLPDHGEIQSDGNAKALKESDVCYRFIQALGIAGDRGVGFVAAAVQGDRCAVGRVLPEKLLDGVGVSAGIAHHRQAEAHGIQLFIQLRKTGILGAFAAGKVQIQHACIPQLPGHIQPLLHSAHSPEGSRLPVRHAHIAHLAIEIAAVGQFKRTAQGAAGRNGFFLQHIPQAAVVPLLLYHSAINAFARSWPRKVSTSR